MTEENNELNENSNENSNEKVSAYITRAREANGLSQEELAREIKITPNILKGLETGDFENLPIEAYIRGYLNSISRRLNLDKDKVLEMFNREYSSNYNAPQFNVNTTFSENNDKNNETSTSTITVVVIIILLLIAFGIFMNFTKFSSNNTEEINQTNNSNVLIADTTTTNIDDSIEIQDDTLTNDSIVTSKNDNNKIAETKTEKHKAIAEVKTDSVEKKVLNKKDSIIQKEIIAPKDTTPKVPYVANKGTQTYFKFKPITQKATMRLYRHGPGRKVWTKELTIDDDYKIISWDDTISVWLDQPNDWEIIINSQPVTPRDTMYLLHGKMLD